MGEAILKVALKFHEFFTLTALHDCHLEYLRGMGIHEATRVQTPVQKMNN